MKLFWLVFLEPLSIIWDFLDNDADKIVSKKGWEMIANGKAVKQIERTKQQLWSNTPYSELKEEK